jgi:hypothetical protein
MMKPFHMLAILSAGGLLTGCTSMAPRAVTPVPASTYRFQEEPAASSLFPADQAVMSDETVQRILSSRVELPARATVALMKFPGSDRSRHYWCDEDYLRLQQTQVDTLSRALLASERVVEVKPLPSLMIPSRLSIPFLREAALRMQADLLMVFRISGDVYSQYRTLARDKVKAYSTCEVVLLDVRTGLIPFTRVVSRERLEVKQSADLDLSETMRRAEEGAATEALKSAAEGLVEFIKKAP